MCGGKPLGMMAHAHSDGDGRPVTILAIDQGTSGTKAIVVDAECGVRRWPRCPSIRVPPGGGVEQDPENCWSRCSRRAARRSTTAGVPIDAVALANQGETVLAWDPDTGEPLTPAIVWQDSRAQEICAELAGSRRPDRGPHRAGPRPVLLRAEDGVAAAPLRRRDGVVTTHGRLAGARAHRASSSPTPPPPAAR